MAAKKRKTNWADETAGVLVEKVVENIAVIEGRLTTSVTAHTKSNVWLHIAECVNAHSTVLRTVEEIKKKWADLKSTMKKKERQRREYIRTTGGGPGASSSLNELEERILSVVSETSIEGINGGVDTFVLLSKPKGQNEEEDTEDPLSGKLRDVEENNEAVEPKKLIVNAVEPKNLIVNAVESNKLIVKAVEPKNEIVKTKTKSQLDNLSDSDGIRSYSDGIRSCSTKSKKRKQPTECDCHKDILCIEQEKLLLEKRKLELKEEKNRLLNQQIAELRTINSHLQTISINLFNTDALLQISPVIKFKNCEV